jgi:hypothetical protein
VKATLEQIGKKSVRADSLDAVMQDAVLREKLRSTYLKRTGWEPWPEKLFSWVVQAALDSKRSAITLASADGRADWNEIEVQAKSEMSHAIPDTWAALKEELENGDADLEALADYFGAKDDCYCGEPIYQFEALIYGITKHYRLKKFDEAAELITRALTRADMEDAEGYKLCTYCAYVMNKDD